MRILFAGGKPPTKAHPWEDPRRGVGHDVNVMTTFFELKKLPKKRVRRYMKELEEMVQGKKRKYDKHRSTK